MDFTNVDGAKDAGFEGFQTVQDLSAAGCVDVPELPGLYLTTLVGLRDPEFLEVSTGGWFKKKDPTVEVPTLRDKWVANAAILYIGQTASSLRRRLRDYLSFGKGKPVAHHGGRYVWQLAFADELSICWRCMPTGNPREEERALLRSFEQQFGCLPFANLQR